MNSQIKLLDTTLRDGGLGLEDAWKNGTSQKAFSKTDVVEIVNHLNASNIDIIELGSLDVNCEGKERFAIYSNIPEISEMIPLHRSSKQMYVGLFRGPDFIIEDIPDWKPGYVDGVRVIIRYSELEKSLDFCEALAYKGYKVFVQPMLTMRYSDVELEMIISRSNQMKAYAVYFVDSYGYMMESDIIRLFSFFDDGLDNDILIGFHGHNNMNLAFSNAIAFLKCSEGKRGVIVDACAMGMGQGAGNLQTELIMPYLMNKDSTEYNYSEILDVCEVINNYYQDSVWGYSVERLIPAIHHAAYKYAIVLRDKYSYTYRQINDFYSIIPEDVRHRYTEDNIKKVISIYKK